MLLTYGGGTLISLEEYLSTVYEPDCEYVDGELLERNIGEFDHAGLQTIIASVLYGQSESVGVYVFAELRVQLSPSRFRIHDITVTKHKGRGRILGEAPFLCIEILSPEDRASRIETKIDEYLAFGVRYIWLIDPSQKQAWSYTREGGRGSAEVLTTSDPDLALPLNETFDRLSKVTE